MLPYVGENIKYIVKKLNLRPGQERQKVYLCYNL